MLLRPPDALHPPDDREDREEAVSTSSTSISTSSKASCNQARRLPPNHNLLLRHDPRPHVRRTDRPRNPRLRDPASHPRRAKCQVQSRPGSSARHHPLGHADVLPSLVRGARGQDAQLSPVPGVDQGPPADDRDLPDQDRGRVHRGQGAHLLPSNRLVTVPPDPDQRRQAPGRPAQEPHQRGDRLLDQSLRRGRLDPDPPLQQRLARTHSAAGAPSRKRRAV